MTFTSQIIRTCFTKKIVAVENQHYAILMQLKQSIPNDKRLELLQKKIIEQERYTLITNIFDRNDFSPRLLAATNGRKNNLIVMLDAFYVIEAIRLSKNDLDMVVRVIFY